MKLIKPTKKQLAFSLLVSHLAVLALGLAIYKPVVHTKNSIVVGVKSTVGYLRGDFPYIEKARAEEMITLEASKAATMAAKEATTVENVQKIINESRTYDPKTGRISSPFTL